METTIKVQGKMNELTESLINIQKEAMNSHEMSHTNIILQNTIKAMGIVTELSKCNSDIQSSLSSQPQPHIAQRNMLQIEHIPTLTVLQSEPESSHGAESAAITIHSSPVLDNDNSNNKKRHMWLQNQDNAQHPQSPLKRQKIQQQDASLVPLLNETFMFPRLFLGRLPSDISEEEIRHIFKPYGEITNVDLQGNFGFLTYLTKASADAAVKQLNGTQLGNSSMLVQIAKVPKCYKCLGPHKPSDCTMPNSYQHDVFKNTWTSSVPMPTISQQNQDVPFDTGVNTRLHIGRIPLSCTERDFTDLFCKYGQITDLFLSSGIGHQNKFGFLNYSNIVSCRKAIKHMDGFMVRNQRISVEFAKPIFNDRNPHDNHQNSNNHRYKIRRNNQ